MQDVTIEIRPALTDAQLNALFAASWPDHEPRTFSPVLARSLAWCGASRQGELVGFVNVAWDGGDHAFLLDPTVHPAHRRRGIGLALVRAATELAAAGGVEWLHVDYDPDLAPFYTAAGFRPTPAGLIRLAGGKKGAWNRCWKGAGFVESDITPAFSPVRGPGLRKSRASRV